MSDTKLKPCPFCGSEVLLHKGYVSYSVRCEICHYEICRRTKEETIARWNTRKPIDRIVEQLEQQAEQYRRRGFEAEQKGFSKEADKYYGKQCSYLHSVEIVKGGGIDG